MVSSRSLGRKARRVLILKLIALTWPVWLAIGGVFLVVVLFYAPTLALSDGGSTCNPTANVNVKYDFKANFHTSPSTAEEQRNDAQIVIQEAISKKITYHGLIYAIAIAIRESGLVNVQVALDHDSLGIFQQRPSVGSWGSASQILDPAHASDEFFKHMIHNVPSYDSLQFNEPYTNPGDTGLDVIVGAVQVPASWTIPYYDGHMGQAMAIAKSSGITGDSSMPGSRKCVQSTDSTTGKRASGEPIVSNPRRQKVLDYAYWALAQKWPYVWDAGDTHGPTKFNEGHGGCDGAVPARQGGCDAIGFDCSGLVRAAYGQIGYNLIHVANAQYFAAKPISLSNIQPGDIVVFGTPGSWHHIGIYVDKVKDGRGTSYRMIDTPTEGKTVMMHYFYGPRDEEFDYSAAATFFG